MEIGKLKQVSVEEMSEDFSEEMHRFWKYFDTGVKEAKAENKRLGITPGDSSLYAPVDESLSEAPLVSESDPETD